jgi:hypothetical protein
LLHRTLLANLEHRVTKSPNCPCFEPAVAQLWLCREIGFGCERDFEKAAAWLCKSTSNTFDTSEILKKIDKEYVSKRAERLIAKLGYETNLAFDPVELYLVQNRLGEAEHAFRQEVLGRKESMGPYSKSYISQLSTLAILLSIEGYLEEAEKASRTAADSSRDAYGEDSDETISALNYLAKILFRRGKWAELEHLQLDLVPRKINRKDIGPTDTTTLNSQNYLVVAYCFQGLYDKSIEAARTLLEFRQQHLGNEHQETLVTATWLCRSLLEKGTFDGLEPRMGYLVAASERSCGRDADATIERKEILAAILLGESNPQQASPDLEKLDKAVGLVRKVLNESSKSAGDSLYVRAQTSFICILALKGAFEEARTEIENARIPLATFTKSMGVDNIENQRFLRVIQHVESLQKLVEEGEDSLEQACRIRESLAHRWKI